MSHKDREYLVLCHHLVGSAGEGYNENGPRLWHGRGKVKMKNLQIVKRKWGEWNKFDEQKSDTSIRSATARRSAALQVCSCCITVWRLDCGTLVSTEGKINGLRRRHFCGENPLPSKIPKHNTWVTEGLDRSSWQQKQSTDPHQTRAETKEGYLSWTFGFVQTLRSDPKKSV